MFSAWGAFVYRHRRIVVLLSVIGALASLPLAGQASGQLSNGGWLVGGSESDQVRQRLTDNFDIGSSLIVVFKSETGERADSPQVLDKVDASLGQVAQDPHVLQVVGYRSIGNDPRFLSTDGSKTYSLVLLDSDDEGSIDLVDPLRAKIQPQTGLSYQLTGYGPLAGDANKQSEEDLARAEIVSFPLAAVILLIVFGSVLAAALPLLVGFVFAIPTTLALIFLVSQQVEMSIYVQSVATMLGLALAIDYSLFLVSRFREELRRGKNVGDAVQIAVATAGKAVTFSGIAVAIGLLGLLFFASPAIVSIGIAGSLVVLCSVLYGITFLPAVLGMLGPRVNSWSVASGIDLIRRRLGLPARETEVERTSRWESMARWVMAHPILVLIPTLLLLLAVGTPFLRLHQAVPDASVLPPGRESRDAYIALRDEFPGGAASPFEVMTDVNGDPITEANIAAINGYVANLEAASTQVTSVESPFQIRNPLSGEPLPPAAVAQLFDDPSSLPPDQQAGIQSLRDRYISGSTVRLVVHTTADAATTEGLNVTNELRETERPCRGNRCAGRRFRRSQLRHAQLDAGTHPAGSCRDHARQLHRALPAVRFRRHPDQGSDHDLAVDHGELRSAGVDLPGRQPVRAAQFRGPGLHGGRQPDHHVCGHLRPLHGLRGPAAVANPGGVPADARQHRVRG